MAMIIKIFLFLTFTGYQVMGNPVSDVTPSVLSPVNKLSLPFLNSLEKEAGKNYAYSPLSLATALGLLREGVDGESLAKVNQFFDNQDVSEVLKKVNAKSSNAVHTKLRSANLVLHRSNVTLKDSYKTAVENKYEATIEKFQADKLPEALKRINSFVNNKTNEMIPKILDKLADKSLVVLVNGVSLDAKWKEPFEHHKTGEGTFHGENGDKKAKFMTDTRTVKHHHCTGKKLQVLELEYQDDLSMLIVLPDDLKGLNGVLSNLTEVELEQQIGKLEPKFIKVEVPKFQIESTYNLIPTFNKMGLGELFSPGANLNKMLNENAYVDEAVHKTVIKVDEDGTKAAAATAFVVAPGSALLPTPPFKADRPFLFFIREPSTKSNLFVGIVKNL